MMEIGALVEWYRSLPIYAQAFSWLFLFFIAIPIVTLTVFQLVETMRGIKSAESKDSATKDADEGKK